MRKTMPAARRVFGESHEVTLKMTKIYADALCLDAGATLDEGREAVTQQHVKAASAKGGYHTSHGLTLTLTLIRRIPHLAWFCYSV